MVSSIFRGHMLALTVDLLGYSKGSKVALSWFNNNKRLVNKNKTAQRSSYYKMILRHGNPSTSEGPVLRSKQNLTCYRTRDEKISATGKVTRVQHFMLLVQYHLEGFSPRIISIWTVWPGERKCHDLVQSYFSHSAYFTRSCKSGVSQGPYGTATSNGPITISEHKRWQKLRIRPCLVTRKKDKIIINNKSF